jgi:hypothetical protein
LKERGIEKNRENENVNGVFRYMRGNRNLRLSRRVGKKGVIGE